MRKFYFLMATLLFFQLAVLTKEVSAQRQDRLPEIDSLIGAKQFDAAALLLDSTLHKGKASSDQWLIGKSYAGMGNVRFLQGKLDEALEQYLLSLKYLDIIKHRADLSKIYSNMGALYSNLKQFLPAKDYLLKAISFNPDQNADKLKTLANLAGVYLEMGNRKQALNTFNEAILLARKLENAAVEAVLYTNLSNYFIAEQRWQEAVNSARQSLSLRSRLQQAPSVITYNNLAYSLVQIGAYKEGIHYYEIALSTAQLAEKKQIYYNLHQAYRALGNHERAWAYIASYDQVKDSLAKLNYEEKVAALDAQYQSAERQRQIKQLAIENNLQKKQLRQQTYLILSILLIVLLVAGMVYLRWKHYQVKDRLAKAEWKHRFLLLQLNPHFIFNAMQSVQHFIYQHDKEKSLEYLHSFGRLMRLVLENSDRDTISLEEEIEMLTHYLHLQQLNSHPSFAYHVCVGDDILPEDVLIPTMLLQPFVENAVNHGVKGHADGKIELIFEKHKRGIDIFIKDNGRKQPSLSQANSLHKSMSMGILQNRMDELNKIGLYQIELKIVNGTVVPGYEGTSVHLHLIFKE